MQWGESPGPGSLCALANVWPSLNLSFTICKQGLIMLTTQVARWPWWDEGHQGMLLVPRAPRSLHPAVIIERVREHY